VRYAADQKAKTRGRILEAAGKVFRREGYHAAGVDKVMAEAGLTAGGFYAHFDSKEALLAEALEYAAAGIDERFARSTEKLSGREWVEAFLGRYLNLEHCQAIDDGCPLAALVSEVARAGEPVKERFEAIVRELVSEVASQSRASDSTGGDARSIAVVALCLGGLGLARSVRDRGYAEQILNACRRMASEILGADGKPQGRAPSRLRKGRGS
jgi:TetR/AcrR family transcriptional regulator, transcriptional repressor for nem operon